MGEARLTAVLLGALADGNGGVDLAVALVAVPVVAAGTVVARLRIVGLGGGSSSGRSSRRRSSGGLGLGGDGGKVVAVALNDGQTQVSIRVCLLAPPQGREARARRGRAPGREAASSFSPRRTLLVGGRGGCGGGGHRRRTRAANALRLNTPAIVDDAMKGGRRSSQLQRALSSSGRRRLGHPRPNPSLGGTPDEARLSLVL